MILLTRRTFLHSSLVAGLASAAEATRTRWLLSSTGPVRVGVAGLGASALEHLALFAAIPGAEIVGLADSQLSRTTQALRQLRELGQPAPVVDRMLDNRTLEAVSLPSGDTNAGPMFSRILAAGLPVLSDTPLRWKHPHTRSSTTQCSPPARQSISDWPILLIQPRRQTLSVG
jgi:hypothetical protein